MSNDNSSRIISLLPAATEIVCLLGLKKCLVGVSHDWDYPATIRNIPKITSSVISTDLSSKEIDQKVKSAKHYGQSVFHIDEKLLQELKPDIILTQELCPVCAISFTEIANAAKILTNPYILISLEPESIDDIFENIKTIAKFTNKQHQAEKIIAQCKKRLIQTQQKISKQLHVKPKLSILIIEWLDPLMVAGHWVPEMVEKAGGKMLITEPKEKSREITWQEVLKVNPDVIIIAPCGFDVERTRKEIDIMISKPAFETLQACKNNTVYFIDGNAYLTRPGPRIIDGVEILAEIFYPQIFPRKYNKNSWQLLSYNGL